MTGRTKSISTFVAAAMVALALYLLASLASVGDWLQPVFYIPYIGAALISGNAHSISTVAFGTLLVLQCYLVVALLVWAYGRLRPQGPEA
jgi:membrane-associated phospholipid phosphatase